MPDPDGTVTTLSGTARVLYSTDRTVYRMGPRKVKQWSVVRVRSGAGHSAKQIALALASEL